MNKGDTQFERENIKFAVENLEDNLQDVQNMVQLLAMSCKNNEEDEHIVRSIHIVDKMLKGILCTTVPKIKEYIEYKE